VKILFLEGEDEMKKNKKIRMNEDKPSIFNGVTILMIVILFGLIITILGINYWKEKEIKSEIKFFSQLGDSKKSDKITQGDQINIFFSDTIQTKTFLENLTVEPSLTFESSWVSDHELQLTVKENLIPDFDYKIKVKQFKSKWGFSNKGIVFSFSTDSLPELRDVYPTNGQIEVETQEEIVFEFEAPLASQYYLRIKTEPSFEFEEVKTEMKNKIIIKPIVALAYDTEYQVTAELKSRKYFDFSRKIGETSFQTKRPSVVVYGWNGEGIPTKTEERSELQEPQISVGKYIDIDLSKQNFYIFEDGKELGAYKVSTGIRGMNTPTGEFKIMAKARRPWSATYGLFMPWFMQFTSQGHGIHELPEWPGGYKEGANHLGIPVSHGCVRLGVGPAEKVYEFAEIGTPIIIHY